MFQTFIYFSETMLLAKGIIDTSLFIFIFIKLIQMFQTFIYFSETMLLAKGRCLVGEAVQL